MKAFKALFSSIIAIRMSQVQAQDEILVGTCLQGVGGACFVSCSAPGLDLCCLGGQLCSDGDGQCIIEGGEAYCITQGDCGPPGPLSPDKHSCSWVGISAVLNSSSNATIGKLAGCTTVHRSTEDFINQTQHGPDDLDDQFSFSKDPHTFPCCVASSYLSKSTSPHSRWRVLLRTKCSPYIRSIERCQLMFRLLVRSYQERALRCLRTEV